MTPEIHATLIAARDWIAGERQSAIESATLKDNDGQPIMSSILDSDAVAIARHYDPILAQLERAIADAAWERADV